jgi:hypothetical protein
LRRGPDRAAGCAVNGVVERRPWPCPEGGTGRKGGHEEPGLEGEGIVARLSLMRAELTPRALRAREDAILDALEQATSDAASGSAVC